MAALENVRDELGKLEQQALTLRKQRDELIRALTSPPHNHTYRAVAEAAGVSQETVRLVRLKGETQ